MDIERERKCYNALLLVYRDKKYSSDALSSVLGRSDADSDFITRLFYGVLEKNVTLEYIIEKLAAKKPKPVIAVILKMGIYMLRYMNVADYAAVDKCVELAKILGKGGASGFINAVLRKSVTVELPKRGECDYLSIGCSLPKWLVDLLKKEYTSDFIEKVSTADEFRTHIRLNGKKDTATFEKALSKLEDLSESKTKYGYYVTHNTINKLISDKILLQSDYAVQSLASTIVSNCFADKLSDSHKVLDLCAAPGGKAVYLKELTGAKVTACDIHEHRIRLIQSYADRIGVTLDVRLNDACVENPEWGKQFDCVICDVPCSGSGDLRSRPDILLNRTSEGVVELSKLQFRILSVAAKYVKLGGKLCYSTCSILRDENESVIERFLNRNGDFVVEDCSRFGGESGSPFLKLYPHIHRTDGFFAAVMRKNTDT